MENQKHVKPFEEFIYESTDNVGERKNTGIEKIKEWCKKHCNFDWFIKDDGKIYSKNGNVSFKNKDSMTEFPGDFGDCDKFDMSGCEKLTSLEGLPVHVKDMDLSNFPRLDSLEGLKFMGDIEIHTKKSKKRF